MKNKGFTLIELMIVIAIIGILAAVAIPQYSQYTKRAKYAEVRVAVSPIKTAVESCFQNNEGHIDCYTSNATATIPGRVTDAMLERASTANLVNSMTLTSAGGSPVITVIPNAVEGFVATDTFILTATVVAATAIIDAHITDWTESGVGCDNGWC